MFFHVIVTTECNLHCRYCFGEALEDTDADFADFEIDYSLPKKMNYDVNSLNSFCGQDHDCVLTFYGGEPLFSIDDIKRIMDFVKAEHFLIQTNGLLLDRLEHEYVNRLHTILVSIDGDEALTDFYRGKGVFRKVISNLKLIRRNGFKGEIIARMTVMEQTDIYKQVTWLLNNDDFSFSSVHWQLNAGFWSDYTRRDFRRWGEETYNHGIRKLVKFWVDQMEKKGKALRIYPFLGITQSFLLGEKQALLRCGAGWTSYAIQTNGYIIACPAMWGIEDYYLGHVSSSNPLKLKKIFVNEPCTKCDIFNVCGGRCLYANIVKRWSPKQYSQVCNTVRNMVDALVEELPRIRESIAKGKISFKDFEFMKHNGCEIIP
jgi:uncharacterized protein